MKFQDILGFLGVWLLPFYLIIIVCFKNLIMIIKPTVSLQEYLVIIGGCLALHLYFVANNIYQYVFKKRRNFRLIESPSEVVTKVSEDKRVAMYPTVNAKFKSKRKEGFILGQHNSDIVRVPVTKKEILHGIIIGSPGSGKSTGPYLSTLINNFMQDNPFTCFVIDIKPELAKKSVEEKNKNVRVVNPTDLDSVGWDVYYKITQSSTDDEVLETIDQIARSVIVENNPKNAFFAIQARKIMKGLLLYYYRKIAWENESEEMKSGFVDAMVEIATQDVIKHIGTVLSDDEVCSKHWKIRSLLEGYLSTESEALNGIKLQLQEKLDVFTHDNVKWCLQDNPNKTNPMDLNSRISIFLSLPENKLSIYSTVFRMIVYQTLCELELRPEGSDPIALILDEFPRIGSVEKITDALATLRSRCVSIWIAVQDLSQLQSIYDKEKTRTILNLCEITCVLSCRDIETIKTLIEWAGTYRETKTSTKKAGTSSNDGGSTVSQEYRNILDASDFMNLRESEEVMLWLKGKYCRVKTFRYFNDRVLNKRSNEVLKLNNEKQKSKAKALGKEEYNDLFFIDENTLTDDEILETLEDE